MTRRVWWRAAWVAPLALAAFVAGAGEDDPFPLVEGAEYVYQGTFKEKQDEHKVLVRRFSGVDVKGFAFVPAERANDDGALLIGEMFGLGGYAHQGDKLVTYEAIWVRDLKQVKADQAQTLLELPPKQGAKTTLRRFGSKTLMTCTVAAIEEVKVPAGTFPDCVKLAIEETTAEEGKTNASTVWLAPGVGMVRWERATGRVDVLVKHSKK